MTTPTFDIRIDANSNPGTVDIEVYRIVTINGERSTDTLNTLAAKHVADRGDIPGDGDQWFDTGVPAQMLQFAQLPDWVRNHALEALAEAYVKVETAQINGYDTHTKNS